MEFESNPVDFQLTSDAFFSALDRNDLLSSEIRFDLIFIDGLHLADQVDKDIQNALKYLKEDGFIVLHDCNPPTEWHAREDYSFYESPAGGLWNGTTWKAFLKWRSNPDLYSCCVDMDFGVGILSKTHPIGDPLELKNEFYEFNVLDENRMELLNLTAFKAFKSLIQKTA